MKDILVARLNSGSVSAFEKIMRRYTAYVFAIVRSSSCGLLSREDIEELVSDTFAALWKQRESVDPHRQLMPYLAVTARNRTINMLRSLRLTVSLDDADVRDADIEAMLERKEAVDEILAAAERLSAKQRNVFIRFYCYGESLSEISSGLGISPSDTRTTLFRAREAIKTILSERSNDDNDKEYAVCQS